MRQTLPSLSLQIVICLSAAGACESMVEMASTFLFFVLFAGASLAFSCLISYVTTRKQPHTEGKNRRYIIGITLFRRHTDETSPRK